MSDGTPSMTRRVVVSLGLLGALSSSATAQETAGQPCSAGALPARCGWIRVPEDRARPDATTLRLRVVVAPAADPARLPDPVFLLLGGPGDAAASGAGSFAGPLRALFPDRDLVFVDQRGTGESNGLFCPGDRPDQIEEPTAFFGSIFPAREVTACRDLLEKRADLTRYLTPDAADDLVSVMDALGYPQANLLGLSYGTRLAQVFARRHPGRVRTLVLSGVMSFDIRAPLYYARDAQDALDRVVHTCLAQAECRAKYPNLPSDVRVVWSALDAGPVEVSHSIRGHDETVRIPLSKGDVGYAVRGMLYTIDGQESLPSAFTAAARGDWGAFVDRYLQRRIRFFATGMHLSVLCSEEVRFLTDEDIEASAEGTFLGSYIPDDMRAACAEWPLGAIPPDYHEPLSTPVPTLLVSGEFDPVTPPRWADGVAAAKPNAQGVVVPGGGHGITAVRGGPRCVGGIVAAFVAAAGAHPPAGDCLAATPAPTFRE